MSNIEPTEEQKQAANAFVARHGEQNEVIDSGGQARLEWSPTHTSNDIARLLAEREAKLRAELKTERLVAEKALVARNDMENERDALRADLARANDERVRASGYLLAAQKSEMAMKSQLADATARVAELEADNTALRKDHEDEERTWAAATNKRIAELEEERVASIEARRAVDQHRRDREAQHLARIAELEAVTDEISDMRAQLHIAMKGQLADDIQLVEGIADVLADTAHYDDAKADAPGVVEVDDEHKNGPCGWSGCGRCGDTEGGEG